MRTITIEEFHAELRAQDVKEREDIALICPQCSTVQSARMLIRAGAGKTFEDVEKYLGWSCVGRFNKAGQTPTGCDWTLGGLLKIHCLEVVDEHGELHPRFEVATPAQAQALCSEAAAA